MLSSGAFSSSFPKSDFQKRGCGVLLPRPRGSMRLFCDGVLIVFGQFARRDFFFVSLGKRWKRREEGKNSNRFSNGNESAFVYSPACERMEFKC